MLSTGEACKARVYTHAKKGQLKRVGKIRAVVFHPNRAEVVGYIVKRPDAAFMFKRTDRFVAADRLSKGEDGLVASDERGTWDAEACKRLGVDYDLCLLWVGMPVKTSDGCEVGTVRDVFYDVGTHEVDHIDISADTMARTLLGQSEIGRDKILGFRGGAIVVQAGLGPIVESGGAAAAAGEAWAKAKNSAAQAAGKAGKALDNGAFKVGSAVGAARKKMSDAVDAREEKGAAAVSGTGERTGADKAANSLGRQLGRASHMFRDFKDEFDRASRGE